MKLKLAQKCVYMSQKHTYFKTNVNFGPHHLLFLLMGCLLTVRFQCLVHNFCKNFYFILQKWHIMYAFSNFQMLSSRKCRQIEINVNKRYRKLTNPEILATLSRHRQRKKPTTKQTNKKNLQHVPHRNESWMNLGAFEGYTGTLSNMTWACCSQSSLVVIEGMDNS